MAALVDRQINTPVGDAPLFPVLMIVSGLYLAWFSIHYWASDTAWPSDPIKAILTGKPIPVSDRGAAAKAAVEDLHAGQQVGTIAAGAGSAFASVGGGAIASAALVYQGTGYAWGGPADKPGNWDCSSFVSYVLGHDLGQSLPGGGKYGQVGYPPHTHGPTTLDYLMFGTAVARSKVAPGDLIVSSEHMGIVINDSQYISARTPAKGVGIDNLSDPFPGGTPVFRRVV